MQMLLPVQLRVSDRIKFGPNQILKLDSSANLGVGTSTGLFAKTTISGSTSDSTTAALSVINNASTSLFFIRSDGKIGVGTTSPGDLLSVHSTGNVYFGGGLTVSGSSLFTNASSTYLSLSSGFWQTNFPTCTEAQNVLYNSVSGLFSCGDDNSSAGAGIAIVQEGGVAATTTADTLNFNASYFNVSTSSQNTVNITLDPSQIGSTTYSFQYAYNTATSTPEIILKSAIGGLTIQDAASALNTNLFEIFNTTGGQLFAVTATSTTIANKTILTNASTTLATIPTFWSSNANITGGTITGITDLSVADGGTGASTLTGLLQGNGTSAITGVTGTAGQIPYFNGTDTVFATSTIFLSTANNIGIGTSTGLWVGTTIAGKGSTSATAALSVINSASTSLFFIRSDGNIGVGTSSPGSMFSVHSTGNAYFGGGLTVSGQTNLANASSTNLTITNLFAATASTTNLQLPIIGLAYSSSSGATIVGTSTLDVLLGGTGVTTITGILQGNGAAPFTSSSTIGVSVGGTGVTSFTGNNLVVSNANGSGLISSSTLDVLLGGSGATTLSGFLFGNGSAPFTGTTTPFFTSGFYASGNSTITSASSTNLTGTTFFSTKSTIASASTTYQSIDGTISLMSGADILPATSGSTLGNSTQAFDTLFANTITPTAALTIGATTQTLSLQGSTVTLTSTDGTVTIASTTPKLRVGDQMNYVLLSATSSPGISLGGLARTQKQISVQPEYPGATMTAKNGCGNCSGTMTSDATTSPSTLNYYSWTSSAAATNEYDIWTQVFLPSDFSAMGTSTTNSKQFSLKVYTTNTGNASSTFEIFDSNGTAVFGNGGIGSPATTSSAYVWTEAYFFTTGGTFTAETYITFRIRVYADTTTDYMRVSSIRFGYRGQY